jgi:polyhydroxybutyrate depolymerase
MALWRSLFFSVSNAVRSEVRVALLLVLICGALGVSAASACTVPAWCDLPTGRYQVREPKAATASSAAPVIVFHHGWRETPEAVLTDPALTAYADKHGVILVAPEGQGQTWSFPGSPGKWRDEEVFARALFAEVRMRFAGRPVIAAGFSQGASMVWWLACHLPKSADAYVAISGGFWEPSPAICSGDGVPLIHIHGEGDVTVPLAGRALRGGVYRQSDLRRDWSIWIRNNQCEGDPTTEIRVDDRSCRIWSDCGRKAGLAFCLHSQGHQVHAADLSAMHAVLAQLKLWP